MLAEGHVANKTSMASSIKDLVTLLTSAHPRANKHAANALAAIALDNAAAQTKITALLVGVLGGHVDEAKVGESLSPSVSTCVREYVRCLCATCLRRIRD